MFSKFLIFFPTGGANYSKFAPDHSYINVLDYDSPRDLANYLLYLDSHPEDYLSYFWWREDFASETDHLYPMASYVEVFLGALKRGNIRSGP